jgi:nitroreductase
MPTIIDTILARRSIRTYTSQDLDVEKIDLLLQAAMAAPSAVNSRPWEFVVVTDKDLLWRLRTRLPFGRHNAPAAIVVCGNERIASNPAAKLFWVQDCSAAAENILIAAAGLGLGAVWVGLYPTPIAALVKNLLDIPGHVNPLCVIYVGYAAESKPPRTQYDAQRIHWQHYGQSEQSGGAAGEES